MISGGISRGIIGIKKKKRNTWGNRENNLVRHPWRNPWRNSDTKKTEGILYVKYSPDRILEVILEGVFWAIPEWIFLGIPWEALERIFDWILEEIIEEIPKGNIQKKNLVVLVGISSRRTKRFPKNKSEGTLGENTRKNLDLSLGPNSGKNPYTYSGNPWSKLEVFEKKKQKGILYKTSNPEGFREKFWWRDSGKKSEKKTRNPGGNSWINPGSNHWIDHAKKKTMRKYRE